METIKNTILIAGIALVSVPAVPELQAQSSTNIPVAVSGYKTPLIGKFYFGFDAGAALQQDITLSDSVGDSEKVTFDPGARMDIQLGYAFTTNWAMEMEMGIIANQVKYSYALGTDFTTVNLIELPVLLNVIYSRPLGSHCSIYAGGGAGGVFIHYEDENYDTTPTASTFGYQGLVGFRYAFSRKWDLGVGYQILGTTGYDVGSGVAYDGYTPTEYKSNGNLTQSILVTCSCKF